MNDESFEQHESRVNKSIRKYQKSIGFNSSNVSPLPSSRRFLISTSTFHTILKWLILFAVILFIINSYETNNFATVKTFRSFLEFFSDSPVPKIGFIPLDWRSVDWGFFNFVKEIIALGGDYLNVLIFILNGILSIVSYIIYIFQFIFF